MPILVVRRLSFAWPDGRPAVPEASFTLHAGRVVGLVGANGSGKSTLLRLLAGLYEPAHGYYQVDGHTRFGLRNLAAIATLITQEAEVFEATLRDNVTFDTDYPGSEVEHAAWLGAFDSVVASLPDGWNTALTERGVNLSGGQRQRLALARGLLAAADSSLLLLDEPTSALDQATEARVFERLRAGLPDTCVVASIHRLAALAHFDKVILMADGQVADAGTVAEVLRRQPQLSASIAAAKAAERSLAS